MTTRGASVTPGSWTRATASTARPATKKRYHRPTLLNNPATSDPTIRNHINNKEVLTSRRRTRNKAIRSKTSQIRRRKKLTRRSSQQETTRMNKTSPQRLETLSRILNQWLMLQLAGQSRLRQKCTSRRLPREWQLKLAPRIPSQKVPSLQL